MEAAAVFGRPTRRLDGIQSDRRRDGPRDDPHDLDRHVDGEYALIVGGSELRQCFHLEVLTIEELRREFDQAGLRLLNHSPESTEWLELMRA